MKSACTRCTGVLESLSGGPAAACPNGVALVKVADTVPATGCLHDAANFRLLPIRSKRHFVPRTGRGKFNCAYNPTNGNLDITVKLNLVTEAKWWFATEGFTADRLLAMKNDFSQSVPRLWDGKWVFRCRKAGFGGLPQVTPRFHIEFGAEDAHFKLIISSPARAASQSTAPGMRSCRGFVSINQIITNDPTVQDRVELQDFHMQDFQSTLAPQIIAQFERERLEDAVKAVGEAATVGKEKWVFLAFDTIGTPERQALQRFADLGKERLPGTHKIPLIIGGLARATEGGGKAQERAQAAALVISTAGFDNPVTYVAGLTGDRIGARIRIDTDFESNVPAMAYNVASHEFGHMIGLPDEYENPISGADQKPEDNAKAVAKTKYISLVGEANLRPPTFPSNTVSMMSNGMSIMAFHTVTTWDALCFLTHGIIQPDEWEISMT